MSLQVGLGLGLQAQSQVNTLFDAQQLPLPVVGSTVKDKFSSQQSPLPETSSKLYFLGAMQQPPSVVLYESVMKVPYILCRHTFESAACENIILTYVAFSAASWLACFGILGNDVS